MATIKSELTESGLPRVLAGMIAKNVACEQAEGYVVDLTLTVIPSYLYPYSLI